MVENILMICAMLLITIGSATQSIESLVFVLRRLKCWRVQDWQLCMDLIQIVQVLCKILLLFSLLGKCLTAGDFNCTLS